MHFSERSFRCSSLRRCRISEHFRNPSLSLLFNFSLFLFVPLAFGLRLAPPSHPFLITRFLHIHVLNNLPCAHAFCFATLFPDENKDFILFRFSLSRLYLRVPYLLIQHAVLASL